MKKTIKNLVNAIILIFLLISNFTLFAQEEDELQVEQCQWVLQASSTNVCAYQPLYIYAQQILDLCGPCTPNHIATYPQYYKIVGTTGPISSNLQNPYSWTDSYNQISCSGLGTFFFPPLNPGTYTVYAYLFPNDSILIDQITFTVFDESSIAFSSTYTQSTNCDALGVIVTLISSPIMNPTSICVTLHAPNPAYNQSWSMNNYLNYNFNIGLWGTYVIETEISNACYDSIHYDTITVGPNPYFTTTGDFCLGGTINFWGQAQNCTNQIQNWHWSFGDGTTGTGQNITHVYQNPGTYNITLTVTGSNPSLQTNTIVQQVTVYSPPDKPVISGYFNTCHGQTTYTIANHEQNFTYYYNINYGGTQVPFTTNQFNINWASYPTGGVLYVTVVDTNGCIATDSIKVFPCCTYETYPNYKDENLSSAPGSTYFSINGEVTVTASITLSGKYVYMGPNAKIIVSPGCTFTISNSTLSAYCGIMWDGIYLNGTTSRLSVNNNTSIIDAKNAIVSNNGGQFQLSGNISMENNYRNIVVNNYSGTHPGTVAATTFKCTSSLKPQYPPVNATRTYSGIEINNVGSITVGNTASIANRNYFNNMDFGIKNYCSNLEVYNNTFQNMTSTGWPSYPPTGGVGIISTASKFESKNLTVGGISNGTINTNKFESCYWGVYADYYQNITIQRDTFNSTGSWTSIYLYSHPTKTIKVLSNVITDGMVGIHNGHCYNSTIDINSNRVTNAYYGIVAQNVNPGVVQKLNIYDNRVWNNTYGNGIWATNIQGVQGSQTQIALISNNYVYMNSANLTQPSNGILVENCPYAFIQLNSVSKSSYNVTTEAQALNLNGIYVQLSPNSDICNNSLIRMGCGLRFYGAMPNSKVKRNAMAVNYFYGVRLDNANIGHQGDATYAWSNTWATNISNNRVQGTPSVVTNWNYVGNYGQANTYCPFPYSVTPPANLNFVNKLYNITSCSIPVQLPLSMQYSPILSNSNNYILTPDENKYWDEQHFYIDMQNSPAVLSSLSLSNSTYQSFYNTLSSGNIGRFVDVTNLMNNEDYSDAEVQNANISPTNAIEINRKNVNQVYLDTWANGRFEFTANERNVLESIAYGEPVLGGDAVYSARVMLGINPPVNNGSNKMAQQQNNTQNHVSAIYPNPANDVAYLDYTLADGHKAQIYFYNLMGTLIEAFTINSSENRFEFSTKNFKSGLYFYVVMLDNNIILESNKLIIIK